MADAVFSHGDQVLQLDYTPSGANVAGGEVVVVGAAPSIKPMIAHRAIIDGELGALADHGGVYDMVSDGTVVGPADEVYWDDTAKKVVGGTGGAANAHFGHTVADVVGTPADGVLVRCVHMPGHRVGT